MALVTCPDCQAQISDAAPACPKCGRPMGARPTRRTPLRSAIMLGAVTLFLVIFAWFAFNMISGAMQRAAEGRPRSGERAPSTGAMVG